MFFWLTRLLLHRELVNLYLHGSDHEKVVFVLVKGGGLKLKLNNLGGALLLYHC